MIDSKLKRDEKGRVTALYSYNILDTLPQQEYDDLTELASDVCNAPMSRINLIAEDRQWAKSIHGMDTTVRETERKSSVCQYTILRESLLEIPDLSEDERFAKFSYVTGKPYLRYYLGVPLINSEGHAIGALCVLDTKPRIMSDRRKRRLQIIANEVMSRLELRRQNKMLLELNEHKNRLMKMLSHDMRSPLNGIIGISGMLKEMLSFENEEHREMLDLIEQSSNQLNEMINSIMSYAIIESEGFKLNSDKTDLREILISIHKLYKPAAQIKNIELSIKQENIVKPVNIDQDKFEQIFGNLLSNAIKFTKMGGSVDVLLKSEGEERERVIILQIADSGIGMSPKQIGDLFTENSESKTNSGTQNEKSTGIGLQIIRHFVELHNGTIKAESKPGKGSVFKVTIPAQ